MRASVSARGNDRPLAAGSLAQSETGVPQEDAMLALQEDHEATGIGSSHLRLALRLLVAMAMASSPGRHQQAHLAAATLPQPSHRLLDLQA